MSKDRPHNQNLNKNREVVVAQLTGQPFSGPRRLEFEYNQRHILLNIYLKSDVYRKDEEKKYSRGRVHFL